MKTQGPLSSINLGVAAVFKGSSHCRKRARREKDHIPTKVNCWLSKKQKGSPVLGSNLVCASNLDGQPV